MFILTKRDSGDKIKYLDLGSRSYSDHKLELAKSDYWFAIVPLAVEKNLNSIIFITVKVLSNI